MGLRDLETQLHVMQHQNRATMSRMKNEQEQHSTESDCRKTNLDVQGRLCDHSHGPGDRDNISLANPQGG